MEPVYYLSIIVFPKISSLLDALLQSSMFPLKMMFSLALQPVIF